MKVLESVFGFYINSSVHVALAVCAMVGVTTIEYQLNVPFEFWGFVFFGSITGYNFVKYAGVAKFHHRSLTTALRAIQLFSLLSFGALVFFALKLEVETLWITAIFGLLTFLYTVPLFYHKSLRTLSGLKVLVVAMVWAGVTVVVPLASVGGSLDWDIMITFVQRFLLVLVLTFPFEIRDLSYDAIALGTFPQRLGVKATKSLGVLMMSMVVVLELFKDLFYWDSFFTLTFVSLVLMLALLLSEKKQSKYFASFWVESIPILWYLLQLSFEELF